MEQQKVDMYLINREKYFPQEKIFYLKEKLLEMDDSKYNLLMTLELKDPTTYLLASIFGGFLGVDRFLLGDAGMGVLKLLTCGCCGVLTIIDWVNIQKKVKELNLSKVMTMVVV